MVDAPVFLRGLKRVRDPQRYRQVVDTLRSLFLMNLDQAPAKLHLHQLTGRSVPSRTNPQVKVAVWTLHATPDDRLKASFTFENGVAYFRVLDDHDIVDDAP